MSPSLTSYLSSFLPSFNSLPFPSLPTNLQTRLLTFLLNKSIGTFVKGGLKDVEGDLARTGKIAIRQVDLDPETIERLLVDLPIEFISGSISSIASQISFPLSLSSQLALEIHDFDLVLRLRPLTLNVDSSTSPTTTTTTSTSSTLNPSQEEQEEEEEDELGNSILSIIVAEHFIETEFDFDDGRRDSNDSHQSRRELQDSVLSESGGPELPGAFDTNSSMKKKDQGVTNEQRQVTILAALIESILKRLNITIHNLKLGLIWEDRQGVEHRLTLTVQELVYGEDLTVEMGRIEGEVVTKHRIKISQPQVWLRSTTSTVERSDTPTPQRTEDESSNESSEEEEEEEEISAQDDMMMSQSIADLRDSFVSATSEQSRASIYQSATGSTSFDDKRKNKSLGESMRETVKLLEPEDPFLDPEVEAPEIQEEKDGLDQLLFSFGAEPIIIGLTTILPPTATTPDTEASSKNRPRPELNIRSSIAGPITLLLFPNQVTTLLELASQLTSSPSSPSPVEPTRRSSLAFTLAITFKLIQVITIYSPFDSSPSTTQLQSFWSHPTTYPIRFDHLKLKLEGMGIWIVRQPSSNNDKNESVFPLKSFSITEHVHLSNQGQSEITNLPILISDPNLSKSYDTKEMFPEFDVDDWIRNRSGEKSGWRTKLNTKAGFKGVRNEEMNMGPAVVVRLIEGNISIEVLPIHLFADLTIIERLRSFIGLIMDSLPTSPVPVARSFPSTNRTPRTSTPTPLSPNLGVEDLSLEDPKSFELSHLTFKCSQFRISLRCPAPQLRRPRALDPLRSGILIVDLHDLQLGLKMNVNMDNDSTEIICKKVLVFFLPASLGTNVVKAKALFSISSLDQSEDHINSILPSISIRSIDSNLDRSGETLTSPNGSLSSSKTRVIDCDLPLLRTEIDKPTLDGLQLFADDLSQYSSRLSLDFFEQGASQDDLRSSIGSTRTERNVKMISSRYFGAKSFSRGGAATRRNGSESDEGLEEGMSAVTIRVKVTDVIVDLLVDSKALKDGLETRRLSGLASDLSVELKVLRNSQNDLRAEALIGDIVFEDVTDSKKQTHIFARTLAPSLTSSTAVPILKIDFTSSVEKETSLKESKVQLALGNFTYHLTSDLEWISELASFVKAPEGAFETVVPNELTRVRIKISDGSIKVTPPNLVESSLVLSIGDLRLATNLMPDMPRTLINLDLINLHALAVQSSNDLSMTTTTPSRASASRYWKSIGFVELIHLQKATVQLRQGNGLVLPDFELNVSDSKLRLSLCADTVSCISELVSDFTSAPIFQSKSSETQATPPRASASRHALPPHRSASDLLASIDPSAFAHAVSVPENPELLDDDVPMNLDYLAEALRQGASAHQFAPPSASNPRSTKRDEKGDVTSDVDGETIRMVDPSGLKVIDEYLTVPREPLSDRITGAPPSVIRCRLTNCDIVISLHEGYDWFTTRKAIEEERRAIRRRLERIRQLLASGQTADASAEQASVLVFGSVQLGLAPGVFDLPPKELLAAINEELDDTVSEADDATTTASVSSWQTMPSGRSTPVQRPVATAVGKARKKLTRSSSSAIDVNLRRLGISFDTFGAVDKWASRLRIDVDAFELLDNIKTSTWRKFLTELRPIDGGVPRASGASMARVEINKMRPVGRRVGAQEEILLKTKVSPIRLYVDQDALDFLKAFGAFKLPDKPSSAPASVSASSNSEPFFQRVEVLPVKIKLDYKAKRVDYDALRRGKTVELMNFFNFDGSEIILRHLVVTGIAGSTKLSDLVQDIWTQDVKANQLADVISGIGPVRTVVNVGSGVANLVLLPIEQVRKDGRIVRGLQKGASAFAKQTTMEALNVGARLATGTQVILESVEQLLGGRNTASSSSSTRPRPVRIPSHDQTGRTSALALASPGVATLDDTDPIHVLTEEERQELISRYAAQPSDMREGIESAYRTMGDHLRSAGQTILAVPMEVYEQSGNDGPVRAVVRAVPVAILKPMIGASEAVSKALLGLRNSFDPDSAEIEAIDKYKQASQQ